MREVGKMLAKNRSVFALFVITCGSLLLAMPAWADDTEGMQYMREEEKLARDVYATFYPVWGNQVFDNIAFSEQSHFEAMGKLIENYDVQDPVALTGVDPGVYPDSCRGEDCVFNNPELAHLYEILIADGLESPLAALLVGGLIEEVDMLDIQHLMDETDDEHIKSVYASLLCGSTNHMRAYARNIEMVTGASYLDASAEYIRQAEEALSVVIRTEESVENLEEILASPMTTCGDVEEPDDTEDPKNLENLKDFDDIGALRVRP
jgi:hypothetical protein